MTDNRTLHRWVSIPLVLFFATIAGTGVALQADMWLEGKSPPGSEGEGPPPGKGYAPASVAPGIALALAGIETRHPGAKLTNLSVDRKGKILSLGLSGDGIRSLRVDLATGAELPPMPPPARGWHYILQDIHAGYFAGTAGRIVSTIAGFGLLFLSFTGLMVYWNLLRRRIKVGRRALFWR